MVSIVGEVGERGDGVLDGVLRRVAIWALLNVANYSIPFIRFFEAAGVSTTTLQ